MKNTEELVSDKIDNAVVTKTEAKPKRRPSQTMLVKPKVRTRISNMFSRSFSKFLCSLVDPRTSDEHRFVVR